MADSSQPWRQAQPGYQWAEYAYDPTEAYRSFDQEAPWQSSITGMYDFSGLNLPGVSSFYQPFSVTSGDNTSGGGVSDPKALAEWLQSNGYTIMQGRPGNDLYRTWIQDANGNIVGAPQDMGGISEGNSHFFRNSALLAAGGYFGGNALAGSSLGGAAGATTGAAGAAGTAGNAYGIGATYGAADGLAAGAGIGGAGTGAALTTGGGGALTAGAAGGLGGLSTSQLLQGAQLIGGLGSNYLQGRAAQNAANIQAGTAAQGQQQLQQAYAALLESLKPYTDAGSAAISQQGNLIGLNGNTAQQTAIDALKASPQFTSAQQLGENRILANASATGGLRGGNVQGALAQFSPALLASTINDQYNRLAGVSGMGLNATTTGGNAGSNTATNVANLLQQQGQAQAGGALASARENAGYISALTQAIGLYSSLGGF